MDPATIVYYNYSWDVEQEPEVHLLLVAKETAGGIIHNCHTVGAIADDVAALLEDAANSEGLTLGL